MCALALGSPALAQFKVLHSFLGFTFDGDDPFGSLMQSGSTLYRMTALGGSSDNGTIFKIETNGTGFSLLHSFAGPPSEGSYPDGSLIRSGSTFYGMTNSGGKYNDGTIFKIGADGTGLSLLHSFSGGDGAQPDGSLIQSGSTLYEMTSGGGVNLRGTIFSLVVPEPPAMTLAVGTAIGLIIFRRQYLG
jgi:uncharacterized repeat protein (TIGR03803 family)